VYSNWFFDNQPPISFGQGRVSHTRIIDFHFGIECPLDLVSYTRDQFIFDHIRLSRQEGIISVRNMFTPKDYITKVTELLFET